MPAGQIVGRISIKVLPDTDEFKQRAKVELDKIERQLTISVGLEIDKASLKQVKNDLDRWCKGINPLKVQVRPDLLAGSTTAIAARLRVLTRPREIPLIPKLDNKAVASVAAALAALSGARVLHEIFDGLFDRLMNLDKAVPLIGSLALAIAGLAAWGIAAASSLATLSASLASIAPLALLLPGLFGGLAVGLGVTIAAFKDFNTVLPGVGAALSKLQDSLSAKFWEQAKAPIQTLISQLLPQFAAGLDMVAAKAGLFFGSFATALAEALGGNPLAGMFQALGQSIDIATGATGSLANIIAVLGGVGASMLPRLAGWFVEITGQFSNFLSTAAADGRLQAWIETALVALADLGTILKSLGSILASVARAAAGTGGSTFGTLAETLSHVADVMKRPEFQQGLAGVFQAAHTAMSAIASGSGPGLENLFKALADSLKVILPIVGNTLGVALGAIADALAQPAFQSGLIEMFKGLQAGITALLPALGPVGQLLGALGPIVGALAQAIGPVLGVALQAVSAALGALLPAVTPVISILGGALMQIITALAPLLGLIGQVLGQVLGALTPILPVLINLVMSILTPLVKIVMNIISAVLPHLVKAIEGLVAALTPVINAIAAVVKWLIELLAPAIEWLAGILLGSFIGIINGVKDVFEGLVNVVMGIWNAFSALFRGDWDGFWEGIKQFFAGIWDIIVGLFNIVMNIGILGVFKKVGMFFKELWEGLWNGIKALFELTVSSIKQNWDTFLKAFKEAPGAVFTYLRNFFKSTWDDITSSFSLAWEAIKKTVVNGVAAVVDFAKNLPARIKEAIGDLGNLLQDAGKKLMQGLIDGIMSMVDKLKSGLKKITDLLPDWKGPASRDRVLLYDAGRLVMAGFIDGLESRYSAVRKSLQGLSSDVADFTVQTPSIDGARTSGLSAAMAAALNGTVSTDGPVVKVLNYHAAPNSSLDSEEDLFKAAARARMAGW